MRDMTEEEYDALDKRLTDTIPTLGHTGTGFFSRRKAALATQSALSITVDSVTANYLTTKAAADHKTPADIVSELVQKEIAAAQ